MVEVEKKLIEILELRKDSLSGEDIKHIVESIMICKSYVEPAKIDPKAKTPQEILKEWMGE